MQSDGYGLEVEKNDEDAYRALIVNEVSRGAIVFQALYHPNGGTVFVDGEPSLNVQHRRSPDASIDRNYSAIQDPARPVDTLWFDRWGTEQRYTSEALADEHAAELREHLASRYRP